MSVGLVMTKDEGDIVSDEAVWCCTGVVGGDGTGCPCGVGV